MALHMRSDVSAAQIAFFESNELLYLPSAKCILYAALQTPHITPHSKTHEVEPL